MTVELAKLLGSLQSIADSTDNKDLKAALQALIRYHQGDRPELGFVGDPKEVKL